ncbi:MAG: tRNA (guanosine(37)-N1)-methyltransferase TrmD [Waddliaceae bacterium]
MRFDIITIFPEMLSSFKNESLLKRAEQKKLLQIQTHNLRNWTTDKHKTVDDKAFGGGLGMVMMAEPIYKAVKNIKKSKKTKVILFTPRGKKFDQKKAHQLSKLDQLIMICGRYEGVDERVAKYIADEEISIGDYVLMGGEVAAMAVIETVSRLIPGVVGKPEFLKERSEKSGFTEYPEYTRPEVLEINGKKRRVPKVLLSGNHKKIEEWKKQHGRVIGK